MSDRSGIGFLDSVFDRTLGNLRTVWRDIAASAFGPASGPPDPDLPEDDAERLREQMANCLSGRGGEVSARARAAELGRTYLALNPAGRERFLRLLAEAFDVDRAAIDRACAAHARGGDAAERMAAERALRAALEAPRLRLLTQFNALPEGVKFLVDMRAELMPLSRGDPALAGLEGDLKALLASWFDIGFLELSRITWEKAPAVLLEKLMLYEAVHEIRGWTDLKNRLEADRRCFAFFHPRMPQEPLIFVEVALVKGMAGDVQALLDESVPVLDPTAADAAIFFSISNCQKGLSGISFGGFLIKRVVDSLAAELPRLKTYATLSPLPGFRAWLATRLAEAPTPLTTTEQKALAALPEECRGLGIEALLALPGWHEDEAVARALERPLLRLAAHYLLDEKAADGRALDPVAHFHLSNGARLERLNWLADRSAKGLQQSAGIMINYRYRLAEIEANHEAYSGEGNVAVAAAVRNLVKA